MFADDGVEVYKKVVRREEKFGVWVPKLEVELVTGRRAAAKG